NTFAFFKAIQHAFYVEQLDVTKTDILARLASAFDVHTDAFSDLFESKDMKAMVQKHYLQTREFGVRGFPTLSTGSTDQHIIFTSGFRPYQELEQTINEWLSE
ncbi:MAG: DsbA family protein, partial [Gammaproteobacteria bacterium]|nr:DsbA family protein [Gammaproteobacteria bacterium]